MSRPGRLHQSGPSSAGISSLPAHWRNSPGCISNHFFPGQSGADTVGQRFEKVELESCQALYFSLEEDLVLLQELVDGKVHHLIGGHWMRLVPYNPRQVLHIRGEVVCHLADPLCLFFGDDLASLSEFPANERHPSKCSASAILSVNKSPSTAFPKTKGFSSMFLLLPQSY